MRPLLSTIFGDITYDDEANAYFWHPWLNQEADDSGGGGPGATANKTQGE